MKTAITHDELLKSRGYVNHPKEDVQLSKGAIVHHTWAGNCWDAKLTSGEVMTDKQWHEYCLCLRIGHTLSVKGHMTRRSALSRTCINDCGIVIFVLVDGGYFSADELE